MRLQVRDADVDALAAEVLAQDQLRLLRRPEHRGPRVLQQHQVEVQIKSSEARMDDERNDRELAHGRLRIACDAEFWEGMAGPATGQRILVKAEKKPLRQQVERVRSSQGARNILRKARAVDHGHKHHAARASLFGTREQRRLQGPQHPSAHGTRPLPPLRRQRQGKRIGVEGRPLGEGPDLGWPLDELVSMEVHFVRLVLVMMIFEAFPPLDSRDDSAQQRHHRPCGQCEDADGITPIQLKIEQQVVHEHDARSCQMSQAHNFLSHALREDQQADQRHR
mmetsp:Transcript_130625/g.418846  ORF Transcript_130625/g.418846 Transcript_130625/m.418846 type:complete len:280 (+) Transcript_130625:672-1511(+)